MKLTYDENKFVEYFINKIYVHEILYYIDCYKIFNNNEKNYSSKYLERICTSLNNEIELTEEGYLLKQRFNKYIKTNNLKDSILFFIREFTIDFTLDTIRDIISEMNLHQFIKIKEKIYRDSAFEIDDLFKFLNRPVEYHRYFIDNLSKIILLHINQQIIYELSKGMSIHDIMDEFQKENNFLLFPYYHYNHKPIDEENKDYIKNKYPELFTNDKAYTLFLNIVEEFGKSKNDLANYSYVFHYLKKNNYIIHDCIHRNFITILKDNNIIISRIKPETDIGNKLNKRRQIEKIISNFR